MGMRKRAAEQDGTAAAPETGGGAAPDRRSSKSRAENGYSGRILVRMPSELHEQLAHAAEREEVSLNRYVNDALTTTVDGPGAQQRPATEAADDTRPSRFSARAVRLALVTNVAVVVLAGIAAIVLLVLAVQRGV